VLADYWQRQVLHPVANFAGKRLSVRCNCTQFIKGAIGALCDAFIFVFCQRFQQKICKEVIISQASPHIERTIFRELPNKVFRQINVRCDGTANFRISVGG
jgi:hypothetical protein